MMSAILDSATRSVSDRPAPFGAIDGGNVCRPTRSLTSRTAHRRQSSRPATRLRPQIGERSAAQFLPRERGRP